MKHSSMETAVFVSTGPLGTSVYAKRFIPASATILRLMGPIISFREAVLKGELESYALQVGIDRYVDIRAPGCYVNHSCDPNAGLRGLLLLALRDIAPFEEIQYDYSTTMDEDYWTLSCRCGAVACRERIRDFKYLPKQVQRSYEARGVVQPYIVSRMRDASAAQRVSPLPMPVHDSLARTSHDAEGFGENPGTRLGHG